MHLFIFFNHNYQSYLFTPFLPQNNQIQTTHNKGKEDTLKNQTIRNKVQDTEINPNNPNTWGKVGRNETCPCGSNKKFKNCHGKN